MSHAEREALAGSVIDKNGVRARLEFAAAPNPAGEPSALVRTEEGFNYLVPADVLVELKDGGYFLPLSLDELTPVSAGATADAISDATAGDVTGGGASAARGAGEEVLVVPVIAEELSVGKRIIEHGRVRITKTVAEREEVVDEPLRAEEATVERVAVNRVVDAAPPVRYEGDVMIVPLVEEVLVVERRLMLREELRISKHSVEVRKPQHVVLRREEVVVERVAAEDAAAMGAVAPSARDDARDIEGV